MAYKLNNTLLFFNSLFLIKRATTGLLFSVLITGVITDAIKDAVGRPRPDFFWRCFPDGKPVSSYVIFISSTV